MAGAWFSIVLAASCGGEKIRLGDATGGSGAVAGNAGAASGAASLGGAGAGAGGSNGGINAGGGSAGSAPTCRHGSVQANEVLWIGDSWVTIPGTQYNRVEELARAVDAIGPSDEYVVLAAAAAGIDAIVNQYKLRQAGATKVRILIMDGGTWDTLNAGGSAASVNLVVNTFKQFLATIASDGTVEHIIYYLVPELPTVAGVAELRPKIFQACAESTVPCHFIDLQQSWAPEYTDPTNGIQASEAGARKIADLVWQTMQDNCIAQ